MQRILQKIQPQSLPQDSDRLESQSQPVRNSPEHSVHQDTEQSREDYQNNHRPQLEDIPELEDEEENWEEGQFVDADLIDHHNTPLKVIEYSGVLHTFHEGYKPGT